MTYGTGINHPFKLLIIFLVLALFLVSKYKGRTILISLYTVTGIVE